MQKKNKGKLKKKKGKVGKKMQKKKRNALVGKQ